MEGNYTKADVVEKIMFLTGALKMYLENEVGLSEKELEEATEGMSDFTRNWMLFYLSPLYQKSTDRILDEKGDELMHVSEMLIEVSQETNKMVAEAKAEGKFA